MPKAFLPCWSSCQFEQERQYGSGQQPPVAVQHVAHEGPILRFLQTNRPVNFCYTKEEVVRQYKTIPESSGKSIKPPPEYAARLQGPRTSGIVRTRVNKTGVQVLCVQPTWPLTWQVMGWVAACCAAGQVATASTEYEELFNAI